MILSLSEAKIGKSQEKPTYKQNLACLTRDASRAQTYISERANDLETALLAIQPRESPQFVFDSLSNWFV